MTKLDTPFAHELADMGTYHPREIDVAAYQAAADALRTALHGGSKRAKHMADLAEYGTAMLRRCRAVRTALRGISLPYSNLLADMIDDGVAGDPLDRLARYGDDQVAITMHVVVNQIDAIEQDAVGLYQWSETVAIEIERALVAIEFELAG